MKPAAAKSVNAKDLHASAIYSIFRFGAAACPAPESEIAAAEAAAAHAHHPNLIMIIKSVFHFCAPSKGV